MKQIDVVIIGAGAAGLMCALTAGQRGRQVLLIDHAEKVGKKILISGGGRCNFTNLWVEADNYVSQNPHFCKSALSRFTQYDFIALVEKHGIAYHEKTLGQLFCDGNAKEIVNLLLAECQQGKVNVQTECTVNHIHKTDTFIIQTNQGDYKAQSLVIATGGLSIPKMGATGFGYNLAKQFGLEIRPCHAALVPFTLNDVILPDFATLAGLALEVDVSCGGQSFREAMLFTHRGLSGPAMLQISTYWQAGEALLINLLPGLDLVPLLKQWQEERPKTELKSLLSTRLPKRLGQYLFQTVLINRPIQHYTPSELKHVIEKLQHWSLIPAGTEGYRKAEVTRGGVDTAELSSKTFETKKVSGLYFIGEVLDVTGWLGGYNFQWAWASGYCAGQFV